MQVIDDSPSSEYALIDAMMPALAPASIAEQIEYGLIGWELSRFSGLWVGMKVVTEIMDSNASLAEDPAIGLVAPGEIKLPAGGLSLRWPGNPLTQEERLHRYKIPAALAFARANGLDRVVMDSPRARLGIVTVGKSYPDTRQALRNLGIGDERAEAQGVRLYKVAMPWPIEPHGVRAFAQGLSGILVVEEKRGLVEDQFRQILYGQTSAPRIRGKHDDAGGSLLPSYGELGADVIAIAIGRRLGDREAAARADEIAAASTRARQSVKLAERPPHFCSGCVLPMERQTAGFTHMGSEGANWIGPSPFSTTWHVFDNIGDGAHFHSGSMAIRAAIGAGVNVTEKILFNGVVAMTGGQSMDGKPTPTVIARQMLAEGASGVVIVSDDPRRFRPADAVAWAPIRHRNELDSVQRELRAMPGTTVLFCDQTCATELRRLRKRGRAADPGVHVAINDLVCEGCGDCSTKSNCLSVVPIQTEYGRKRAID